MKKTIFILFIAASALTACTHQTNNKNEMTMEQQQIADKLALRELVETFANLSDTKEVDAQLMLFTENATVETYMNNELSTSLTGHADIGNAFRSYLDLFHSVYHLNGQSVSEINGDTARATTYCWVTLIGDDTKHVHHIIYNDEFARQPDGKWLITKRKSNFVISEIN